MRFSEYMDKIRGSKETQSAEMFIAESGYAADCEYSPEEYLRAMRIIYAAGHNDIAELIRLAEMGQKGFATYFDVPLRTVQSWAASARKTTDMTSCLIGYALLDIINKKENDD